MVFFEFSVSRWKCFHQFRNFSISCQPNNKQCQPVKTNWIFNYLLLAQNETTTKCYEKALSIQINQQSKKKKENNNKTLELTGVQQPAVSKKKVSWRPTWRIYNMLERQLQQMHFASIEMFPAGVHFILSNIGWQKINPPNLAKSKTIVRNPPAIFNTFCKTLSHFAAESLHTSIHSVALSGIRLTSPLMSC